jgi:hypothetical protein
LAAFAVLLFGVFLERICHLIFVPFGTVPVSPPDFG